MTLKRILSSTVLAPLIVAVVVGVGSSYVTTRVQIGTITERLQRHDDAITRLRMQGKAQRSSNQDMRERLTRLETKIDLLLESQGIKAHNTPRKGPR